MGLFDYINFSTKCPNCSAIVSGFQSKDSGCMLQTLEPWTVRNFYTSCSICKTCLEYTYKHENLPDDKNVLLDEAIDLLNRLKDVIYEYDYQEVQKFLDKVKPNNWLDNYNLNHYKLPTIPKDDKE